MKGTIHFKNRMKIAGVLLVAISMLLTACAPQVSQPIATPPTQPPAPTQPAPTQPPAPTQAPPTAAPTATSAPAPTATSAPAPTSPPAATQAPAPTSAPAQPTSAPSGPNPTPVPSVPVAVLPTPAAGGPAVTANVNTYLFSGPGTNYVVYSTMTGGTTATPVGKNADGTWFAVSIPIAPMGQGWVDASKVKATNADSLPVLPAPPVPPTTNMVPPGPSDPQATALANVNVRSGPSTQYPIYGIAIAGQTGRVLGKSEDGKWWVVRLDPTNVGAGYGWVSSDYVQASNTSSVPTVKAPAPSTPQPLPPPAANAPTVTAIENVNIRSGPGTNYPVYGTAAPGATAEVTGKSQDGGWWQIKVPTKYSPTGLAWVSASYVIAQNTQNVPVVAAPPPPPTQPAATAPPSSGAACQLVSQSPANNTAVAANSAYPFSWVIKNTGTTKWDQSEYDVIFISSTTGYSMSSGNVFDLPTTVQPGATVTLAGTGITPGQPGQFTETWAIAQGGKAICPFSVTIQVK